ncbi:MAG TPA: biopolymer transporter ExbD [Bryobacteraceae bacterium]|nr:biopolymer transporter ExbD [Bryobacteraceae bacterium]
MGGSNGFRMRGRRAAGGSSLSEMNVVPLVDVVLVLLIIFMLTAQAMEVGLDIKVPETVEVQNTVQDLPVVEMTSTGKIYLGDKPINVHDIPGEIARRYKGATAVYLRADGKVPWEQIANVMAILGKAKLAVNVVTKPSENTK